MAVKRSFIALLLFMLLSGCVASPVMPVTKIALLAPFEGRLRDVGYDALFAARLALSELDTHDITLLAVDDGSSVDSAAERMTALALDPAVQAVIALGSYATSEEAQQAQNRVPVLIVGYWQTPPQTANMLMLANRQIPQRVTYRPLTLPQRIPDERLVGGDLLGLSQMPLRYGDLDNLTILSSGQPPDADFHTRYAASAPFAPDAGLLTTLTYDAVGLVLAMIVADAPPATLTYEGINGRITFENAFWRDAPLYSYRFGEDGQLIRVDP